MKTSGMRPTDFIFEEEEEEEEEEEKECRQQ